MMKKYLTLLIFICSTNILISQSHELGVFFGGSNYIGDIGSTTYLNPNNIGGGVIYKYNLNPRIALRAAWTQIGISGDDADSSNDFRVNRQTPSLNFNNSITELALGVEFNFFEYNTRKPQSHYTPYILLEFANFYYTTIEEQTTTTVTYENTSSFSIPVGLGFKGHLSYHLAYAIETAIRFTFVDDIDDTVRNAGNINFQGFGNDYYVFTGVSLVYTFGRPSCYAPRE